MRDVGEWERGAVKCQWVEGSSPSLMHKHEGLTWKRTQCEEEFPHRMNNAWSCMHTWSQRQTKGTTLTLSLLKLNPPKTLTETETDAQRLRRPSLPHYLPVEAILIHIVCSLRLHFSFPLRIEADLHMADEESEETAGSVHMDVHSLINWLLENVCACFGFRNLFQPQNQIMAKIGC